MVSPLTRASHVLLLLSASIASPRLAAAVLFSALVGVIVGFLLAIPPGPVALAILRQAAAGRRRIVVAVALGSATAESCYTTAAAFIASPIVSQVKDYILAHRPILVMIQVLVVSALVGVGLYYLFFDRPGESEAEALAHGSDSRRLRAVEQGKAGLIGAFFAGVGVAFANVLNPAFMPSLIATISFIQGNEWVEVTPQAKVVFALAFGGGALTWFLLMSGIILRFRKVMPRKLILGVQRVAGGAFFLFGIVLFVRLVRSGFLGT